MSFDFPGIERLVISQFWQVTAVILVVGLLTRFFLRRHSHWAYALWLVVLLKCLLPPIWSSPTGVFSWISAERARSGAAATSSPLPTAPADHFASAFPAPATSVKSSVPLESPEAVESPQVVSAPPTHRLSVLQVLSLVWLCGAAALAGLLFGRKSYYSVLLRHNRIKTEVNIHRLIEGLSQRLGLRRHVDVLVTTQPFGPAVYGFWRPILILPEILFKKDLAPRVERIIAHELIHVRRRDNLVGEFQLLVQILWWFHPLVWWTNRRICREREFCCDEEVMASLDCDPGKYAQDLLDVLKLRRQLRPALLPGMDANEVTTIRLEKIMDKQRTFHRRMPRACWAMLIAGILVVLPGAGIMLRGEDAASQSAAETKAAETLGKPDLSKATGTETTLEAVGKNPGVDLQELISKAKPRAVLTLPPGVYTRPIAIDRPLTIKGQDPEKCVLELTANEPAVSVSCKESVILDSLTIKWQLATSDNPPGPPCALAVKDGNATVRNCRVIALGNFKRCPAAVQCLGFSRVKLEHCTFEGFEYCINYTGGAEGSIVDCVILNPGHCGITVYSGSKIEVARNIVTGSQFHGLRCTGGKLLAHDNLIIANKNRGIYLGNRPAGGTINNNVIMSNGAGISAFGNTNVDITNNLFLKSDYAGLDTRDSCSITVRNNVFQDNPKGIVLFTEAGRNKVTLGQNTFWNNTTDTENIDKPKNSLAVNPRFAAPQSGDFTAQAEELKKNQQGLSNPGLLGDLWQKWKALSIPGE